MHTLYQLTFLFLINSIKKFQIHMCQLCDYIKYKFTSFHKNRTTKIILHIFVDYKMKRRNQKTVFSVQVSNLCAFSYGTWGTCFERTSVHRFDMRTASPRSEWLGGAVNSWSVGSSADRCDTDAVWSRCVETCAPVDLRYWKICCYKNYTQKAWYLKWNEIMNKKHLPLQ